MKKLARRFEKKTRKTKNMNPLIKTLSAVALGGLFAGTAIAGPGDAYASFGTQPTKNNGAVQVALFRPSAKNQANVETKIIPSANPKNGAVTTIQVTRAPSK